MRGKVFGLQNNVINIAEFAISLGRGGGDLHRATGSFLSLAAIVIAGGILTWYICRTET